MGGALYWRKTTILAGMETAYGEGVTLTGAHALRIKDASVVPMEAKVIDRGFVRPHMGASEKTHVGVHRSVKFGCELSGSGSAGTVPGYSTVLRSCCLAEIVRAPAATIQASPGTPAAGNAGTWTYTTGTSYTGGVTRTVTITTTTAGASGVAKVTVAAPAVGSLGAYNQANVTVTNGQPLTLPGGAAILPVIGTALAVGDSWTISVAPACTLYRPVSDDFESGEFHFHSSGILYRMRGARGTASLSFAEEDVPKISFDGRGLWDQPTNQVPPTPAPAGFVKGLAMSKVNTPVARLFGHDIILKSLEVSLGNTVEYKDRPNSAEVFATRPGTTATINFQYPKLADFDVEMAAHDDLLGALELTHGLTAGNIVDLAAARVQITEPKREQEGDLIHCSANLTFVPSDAGNDDFTLTVR
ncbi:hypothetical protein ACJ41P_31795 [Azospirillum argentinense]|uniref:Uncharacterized protein n=1 Tax=Azospirillum argentinense TaxID=2970906 RepID=A0ABW8VIA9_9PROT